MQGMGPAKTHRLWPKGAVGAAGTLGLDVSSVDRKALPAVHGRHHLARKNRAHHPVSLANFPSRDCAVAGVVEACARTHVCDLACAPHSQTNTLDPLNIPIDALRGPGGLHFVLTGSILLSSPAGSPLPPSPLSRPPASVLLPLRHEGRGQKEQRIKPGRCQQEQVDGQGPIPQRVEESPRRGDPRPLHSLTGVVPPSSQSSLPSRLGRDPAAEWAFPGSDQGPRGAAHGRTQGEGPSRNHA